MAKELPFATCSDWPTAGLTHEGMNVSAAYATFAKDSRPATRRITRNLPFAITRTAVNWTWYLVT
ncbi:hypothetical protein MCEMIEM13_00863 [Comamonadaceae bacterium]